MKLGSLFSGIGGFELGLRPFGVEPAWQVEYEPFATRVLAKHWPSVTRYGDIRDVDWSQAERVDVVTGGFPCQPISSAGKQRGLNDDMWLWPEFARCLRELRPKRVLVENSPNLTTVNDGDAFSEVLGDLAALGYDVRWGVLGAYAVGAPHKRDRIWIFAAHSDEEQRGETGTLLRKQGRRRVDAGWDRLRVGNGRPDATTRRQGWPDPPQPTILGMGDGLPKWLDARTVSDDVPPEIDPRRIAACGNAVVPAVVTEVWRQAMAWHGGLL